VCEVNLRGLYTWPVILVRPRSSDTGRATGKFIAPAVALLVASSLGLSATPVRAGHAASSAEAAAATKLSPDQFVEIFDNAELPGLGDIGPAPSITGDAGLDARIRAVGEQRGYTRRPLPNRPLAPFEGWMLQPEAAEAWRSLRAAAREAGLAVRIVSAYRGEAHQATLYRRKAGGTSDAAINRALQVVAVPGYSKHHTGYAIDLAAARGDHNAFGNTPTYRWLAADNFANAKAHGWIPSYPAGSRPAGPNPEPWEFVWVGHENIVCGGFVPTPEHPFCDTFGSAFEADASWLAAQGITTGCGPNRFCVNGDTTRAQAATLLWRYAGRPAPGADTPFVDVPQDSYYSQAVSWMYFEGLTTGTSATSFDPHRLVSRAEFVTFLWRLASRPEPGTRHPRFADVAASSFAAKAVNWAAETGIATPAADRSGAPPAGGSAPRFEATAATTRGQAAGFIRRLADHREHLVFQPSE